MSSGYAKYLVLAALFAGLAYVANFLFLFLPNISPAFIIIFMAGYILGFAWGAASGATGFFLIAYLNPYGLSLLPLLVIQVIGGIIIALCGASAKKITPIRLNQWFGYTIYAFWGFAVSSIYMGFLSITDAFLFGPFVERFLISIGFSIVTIVSNLIIFPILMPLIKSIDDLTGRI